MTLLLALVVAAALTSLAVLFLAKRRHVIDVPNERSSHTRPTPRGGGIAVVIVTLIGLPLLVPPSVELVAYWLTAALIAVVGWMDDVRGLRAATRLAAQLVASAALIAAVGPLPSVAIPGLGSFALGAAAYPLTALWMVGLTNAYNFMDGIDGLAASQAVIAGVAWAVAGACDHAALPMTLGGLIAAGALGFAQHNWPPARIFLGDVGSTFLGFSFAALPLLGGDSAELATFALWVMAPFWLDAGLTFGRRLVRGAAVWQAHREHLYQRLVQHGRSHRTVTLWYATAGCGLAAAGILWLCS